MFEQKGFCGDGTDTTWAEQLCDGDQQVDGQDEEVAHAAHRSMTATGRQTAPHGRIPSYFEFAIDSPSAGVSRPLAVSRSPHWSAARAVPRAE